MFKKILVLIFIDFLITAIWLLSAQLANDMAIVGVVIPPIIFIANLLVAATLLFFKETSWAGALAINSITSSAVFIFLLQFWFSYSHKVQYKEFYFARNKKNFELTIEKIGAGFNIVERIDAGAANGVLYGIYSIKHDTTFLIDVQRKKNCFIYHGKLYGFGDTIKPIILTSK